jgi:hypothetical protein
MSPFLADFVAKVCVERNEASVGASKHDLHFATRSLGSGGFDAQFALIPG